MKVTFCRRLCTIIGAPVLFNSSRLSRLSAKDNLLHVRNIGSRVTGVGTSNDTAATPSQEHQGIPQQEQQKEDVHKEGLGTGKKARLNVDLDKTAENYLAEHKLKPKKHPGVFYLSRQELPDRFVAAVERILSHENASAIADRAEELCKYLWSRKLPVEDFEYKEKVVEVESKLSAKDDVLLPFLSQKQLAQLNQSRENKTRNKLKQLIYHWEPLNYTRNKGLEYLLGRSAAEYAVLLRIFSEIVKRDSDFKPKSLFDFGSGVGTVVWASRSAWRKSIGEYMCVDTSREMNDLAEIILRGGSAGNDHGIPGLYFRQFLPQSSRILYDVVVSSYTLMELPSMKARLQVLDMLWKKTKNYLVIVEPGTNAGFNAVIEARDYILQLDRPNPNKYATVFSPCSSSTFCPRFALDDVPCNFRAKYKVLYPYHKDTTCNEVFSYVVLKKGLKDPEAETWPRLVYDPLIRKRHVICRVCTKEGKLSEVLLTKSKHSQTLYRVGRRSHGGDLLPVKEISNLQLSDNFVHDVQENEPVEEK